MKSEARVEVPAEHWETLREAYSAQLAAEHKGKGPISVKTTTFRGHRYTVFGIHYGPWGGRFKPTAFGYRLLPESMYNGETTLVYHDDEAIRTGRRERGDHTGLIVSVTGKRMVCAEAVAFEKGLPTTSPIALSEAQEVDERRRRWGWRALHYRSRTPEWFSFVGHPVARYQDDDGDTTAVLFWRYGDHIEELTLTEDAELSAPSDWVVAPPSKPVCREQFTLF